MAKRFELQDLLETTLGSKNVYFQPPHNLQMKYPCIVYKLVGINTNFASNGVYKYMKQYSVTSIDSNPDSDVPVKILGLPHASFSTRFAQDNLNHTVFNIYF